MPFALQAAHVPPSDDNGWGYGDPVVSDAGGAREEASARHLVAKALATHLASASAATPDPLTVATAAAANDPHAYVGEAHLHAARALIDAEDWERARIAALGIAFWARGASMRPELRSLGLYIEILARTGHEVPLAVAERQFESIRTSVTS